MIRVLEVGPANLPVTAFIADPEVEYVGVDPLLRGSTEEGFWQRVRVVGGTLDRVTFCNSRLQELSGSLGANFDIAHATNVMGDPQVVLRGVKEGELGDEMGARSFVENIAARVRPEGIVSVLETYTPLELKLLNKLFGLNGLHLEALSRGAGAVRAEVIRLYGEDDHVEESLLSRMDDDSVSRASSYYYVSNQEPYLATFRKKR